MVIQRHPEGSTSEVKDAKIAVYMCPIEVAQAEAKTTVVMNDDQDLMNFSKGEEKEMESFVKSLQDKGISAVIVNGTVSDLAMHFFNNHEIMVIRHPSKWETKRLARAVNAGVQTKLIVPVDDEIGFVKRL